MGTARYVDQPASLVNASDIRQYRPVRLNGVELAEGPSDSFSPNLASTSSTPALADLLDDVPTSDGDVDPTVLSVDRNHEYTVWLSYSEVYNEKVYDLFAAIDAPDAPSPAPTRTAGQSSIPRPTSSFLNLPLPSSQSNPLLLTRKALAVKPCPPGDTGLTAAEAAKSAKSASTLKAIIETHDLVSKSLDEKQAVLLAALAVQGSKLGDGERSYAVAAILDGRLKTTDQVSGEFVGPGGE